MTDERRRRWPEMPAPWRPQRDEPPPEINKLTREVRSYQLHRALRDAKRAVSLSADGWSNARIAEKLGVTVKVARELTR